MICEQTQQIYFPFNLFSWSPKKENYVVSMILISGDDFKQITKALRDKCTSLGIKCVLLGYYHDDIDSDVINDTSEYLFDIHKQNLVVLYMSIDKLPFDYEITDKDHELVLSGDVKSEEAIEKGCNFIENKYTRKDKTI